MRGSRISRFQRTWAGIVPIACNDSAGLGADGAGGQEEGIEQMRQGLVAHQETGTEIMRPHFLALLAEAVAKARQPADGLRLLEEALGFANQNGDRYYLAELYRIKGKLLLMQSTCRAVSQPTRRGKVAVDAEPPAIAHAEECFNESIKIAQQQKAKSWELRAVMSLARLYKDQRKRKEARNFLTQIYDRFTEGFDTMDLREAKALLDELS